MVSRIPYPHLNTPDSDLRHKNVMDLPVGNHQPANLPFGFPALCQISGRKENTPYIFDIVIQFFVSQFLIYHFHNRFTGNQTLYFIPRLRGSIFLS